MGKIFNEAQSWLLYRLKTVRTAENVKRVANDEQHALLHACVNCSCRFRPTATSFALRCRSTHISTLRCQFYEAQLPVFFSKCGNNCSERNN